MTLDYDYYLQGCWDERETPLPYWRFRIAYSLYQRHFYEAVELDLATGELRLRKNYLPLVRWSRLRRLAKTVDRGREIATSGWNRFDDGGGQAGGPGVREPRRPVAPTLVGAAARSFEPPVSDYDRSMLH